ncbi:MAG: MBL fold metallo-hydrolase, partial [Alphaproteobacteria bacterium]
MAKIDIIVLPVLKDNYAYILHNNETGECAIIDPSVWDEVIAYCDQRSWKLNYIVNTHHHWDHVGGNLGLKEKYGARVYGADADKHRIPGIDQTVTPGKDFDLLGVRWQVIDTPGHTIGHVAFYIPELKALFCGDTLFGLGVG